jgi:hypothetical protein
VPRRPGPSTRLHEAPGEVRHADPLGAAEGVDGPAQRRLIDDSEHEGGDVAHRDPARQDVSATEHEWSVRAPRSRREELDPQVGEGLGADDRTPHAGPVEALLGPELGPEQCHRAVRFSACDRDQDDLGPSSFRGPDQHLVAGKVDPRRIGEREPGDRGDDDVHADQRPLEHARIRHGPADDVGPRDLRRDRPPAAREDPHAMSPGEEAVGHS